MRKYLSAIVGWIVGLVFFIAFIPVANRDSGIAYEVFLISIIFFWALGMAASHMLTSEQMGFKWLSEILLGASLFVFFGFMLASYYESDDTLFFVAIGLAALLIFLSSGVSRLSGYLEDKEIEREFNSCDHDWAEVHENIYCTHKCNKCRGGKLKDEYLN